MYLNMKKVYVLPADKEVTNDMLGELGFFEKFSGISKDQTGFIVKNFNIKNVSIYEDNILLRGTTTRTGLEIVGIDLTNLTDYKEYAVRLVTSDACEIDSDVFKN